ncbi:WD40 repeat domain-containing protein [Streptomyces sp. NPDC050161]|uniref:WD40 repeat domain-containing protein n=1 Tax=Streptomyces sp. NPDC050161 TaxID=3365604 RepID=UPI0037A48799
MPTAGIGRREYWHGRLHVWDAATAGLEHSLLSVSSGLQAVEAFTRGDGQVRLVTISADVSRALGPPVIWDPATGEQEWVLTAAGRTHALCAFAGADGAALLATVDMPNREVRLWDLASGSRVGSLNGYDGNVEVLCAVTGPDGRARVAAGTGGGTVYVWNPADGTPEHQLAGHTGSVTALCAVEDPDGGVRLASGDSDGRMCLWNLRTGVREWDLTADVGGISALCAFPGSDARAQLAAGGSDGWLLLCAPGSGGGPPDRRIHAAGIRSLCAYDGPDGRARLAAACSDGTVRVWDPLLARRSRPQRQPAVVRMATVCAGADGRAWLATCADDRAVQILDPESGAPVHELTAHEQPVEVLTGFTDTSGRPRLATGGRDRAVRIWDPETGTLERELTRRARWLNDVVAFTAADGTQRLATVQGLILGRVRVWDPATGRCLRKSRTGPATWVLCVFNGDGHAPKVVRGGPSDTVFVTDAESGHCERRLVDPHDHHDVRHLCALTGEDGRTLLAVGRRSVRIWDPGTGAAERELDVPAGSVKAMCVVTGGAGGDLLATGGTDRAVRVWDCSSGVCLSVIPVHHPVHALCSLGRRLFVGSEAGLLALDIGTGIGPAA